MFIATIFNISAQNIQITQLTSTSLNGGINENVRAISSTGTDFLSNTQTVVGNTIELTVCFWVDTTLPILFFNNDFMIPLSNIGTYSINVHINLSYSQITYNNFANTSNQSMTATYLSAT